MNSYPLTVNTLQEAVSRYRKQIDEDPTNMQARQQLAWCLFVLSVFQAGRESAMGNPTLYIDRGGHLSPAPAPETRRNSGEPASQLLQECLRETTTVTHLCRSEIAAVDNLKSLIGLSFGAAVVEESDAVGDTILKQLITDMASETSN